MRTRTYAYISAVAVCLVAGAAQAQQPAGSVYVPHTPSQLVECNQVDKAIAAIPKGDGVDPVTDDELGPGGWRYSGAGGSFVTFEHHLNTEGNGYDVNAGRSNVAGNFGTPNDYPQFLDLPQSEAAGLMLIVGKRGQIVLSGDTANDPPLFALPGAGEGSVRINVQDPDGDGRYEGCATSPMLKNFGFVKPEGGNFVQQELFKAVADVDENGTVTFFEWTEISTFKNTDPHGN